MERFASVAAQAPDLVERAMQNAGRLLPKKPRWAHVMEVFAVGSTRAKSLCDYYGLNPDEEVGLDDEGPDDESE